MSLIFEFADELTEIIDIEKDELKLFFEKYQLFEPQITQPKLHQIKHLGGVSVSET